MPLESAIPSFRGDGYCPPGLYMASEAEVTFRFGASTPRRRRLALRLRRWVELVRQIEGKRLLVDGSFVTAKPQPNDIDAVVLLPPDFDADRARVLTRHWNSTNAAESTP